MTRYTVTVFSAGEGSFCSYLTADDPAVVPDKEMVPLHVPPPLPDLDTQANAEAHGALLNGALRANAAVAAALAQICDTAYVFGTCATLLFELPAAGADNYSWEAIHAPTSGFPAISRNCRVARIKRAQLPPVEMPDMLRVMAFISAAGVPGSNEFAAFVAALEAGRRSGAKIEARVLVGEQTLLDQPGDRSWLSVERIPAASADFETMIRGYAPHVLHFFCHGLVGGGGPDALEFATVNDWAIDAPMGTALLGIDRLGETLANGATWLVVLNCCQGGASRPGVQSMASNLVSKKACAAAVGMVKPIDAAEATLVTAAFHTALFEQVLCDLAKPPASGAIDFTPAIAAAHQRFYAHCMQEAARQPGNFGRWVMPVLYLAAETLPFYGRRPLAPSPVPLPPMAGPVPAPAADRQSSGMDQAHRDRLAIYARTLRSLPADTPIGVRAQILALGATAPAIPLEFWPDLFGNFAAADAQGTT